MVGTMSQKSMKVSPSVHQQVKDLARTLGTSANGVLLHLLNTSSVAVPLEPVQRERWEAAAAACGVSLAQFILLRMEALLYGALVPDQAQSEPPHATDLWAACSCRTQGHPSTSGVR